jgi:hypothetical protein
MLSRIDGVNNYLMFSDKLTQWDNPDFRTSFSMGFTQIGVADLRFGLRKAG